MFAIVLSSRGGCTCTYKIKLVITWHQQGRRWVSHLYHIGEGRAAPVITTSYLIITNHNALLMLRVIIPSIKSHACFVFLNDLTFYGAITVVTRYVYTHLHCTLIVHVFTTIIGISKKARDLIFNNTRRVGTFDMRVDWFSSISSWKEELCF